VLITLGVGGKNLFTTLAERVARFEDACAAAGPDPTPLARIHLSGCSDQRPPTGIEAFRDDTGRCAAAGITDVVVHHPRSDDPERDGPPEILDDLAASVLPGFGG
jgi:hypothetical protein